MGMGKGGPNYWYTEGDARRACEEALGEVVDKVRGAIQTVGATALKGKTFKHGTKKPQKVLSVTEASLEVG
jgi:hypothetical protein